MKKLSKTIQNAAHSLKSIRYFDGNKKTPLLFLLSLFILFILISLVFWVYRLYFQWTVQEGFTQSLMFNVTNSCNSLASNLKNHLNDPSNADLSGNTYYITRLLKETSIKETVLDLSNQLDVFNTKYCYQGDCSGIPQVLIQDISQNITKIGDTLQKMDTLNEKIKMDYKNIQHFYQLTFDCKEGVCE